MSGYGDGFQYSVFLCQLSEKDETVLYEKLKDIIHHREDQIVMVRLSPVSNSSNATAKWSVLGRPVEFRDFKKMIY